MCNKFSLSLLFFIIFNSIVLAKEDVCPIIPKPFSVENNNTFFNLNAQTPILVNTNLLEPLAVFLQKEVSNWKQISLQNVKTSRFPSIHLILKRNKKNPEEGYILTMSKNRITVKGSSISGVFYGVQSVLQLIAMSENSNGNLQIPCWNVTDKPKYAWRGLMLDESRHFFGKEKVKSTLDWMAFYKLNHFHWHLTDQHGWRIEIKSYPLLTLVGGIGSFTNPIAKAQFYTQEEIKEIVAYATERHIEVIPEIDMPGHASAANRAYPEFNGGGTPKHVDFTFNPGKEGTYKYLNTILKEVGSLFPSNKIHIGGDEVNFASENWLKDPDVKNLLQGKNLKNVKEVEQYFVERMADSLFISNKKVLGWDEIAEFNLPTSKTILFWWRHDQPKQLKLALDQGFSVVLCPRLPLYFDFIQNTSHKEGRTWSGGINSLQSVYEMDTKNIPVINQSNIDQIIGIQANVWTETMPTQARLDFMLFPRITALAEVAWNYNSTKDFTQFENRLQNHLILFKQKGILFYDKGKD